MQVKKTGSQAKGSPAKGSSSLLYVYGIGLVVLVCGLTLFLGSSTVDAPMRSVGQYGVDAAQQQHDHGHNQQQQQQQQQQQEQTSDDPCVNTHPQCDQWAKAGECDANPSYMLKGCP